MAGRPKKVPTQYDPAETVETMASQLIPKYHSHLVNARIAYLWINKEIKEKGRIVVGKAEKVNDKMKVLCEKDFIITFSYPTFQELTDNQRWAAVDHELTHCFVDEDDEGNTKFMILPHDFSDFNNILDRYGLYTSDLAKVGEVASEAACKENKLPEVVLKKQEELKKEESEVLKSRLEQEGDELLDEASKELEDSSNEDTDYDFDIFNLGDEEEEL